MLASLKETFAAELKQPMGGRFFLIQKILGQTLLFEYLSNSSKTGYIRPLVKIEIEPRSEHWPVSEHKIESYVKEALKEILHEPL